MQKINERICVKCGHDDRDSDGYCRTIVEIGQFNIEEFRDCGCECYFGIASVPTTREGVVGEVIDERISVYGEPVEAFARVAEVWSGILGVHINASDVPLCMMGLKLVRTQIAPAYSDNSDDIEGYLDIFRKVVGEDMVHARSVTEYLEKRDA